MNETIRAGAIALLTLMPSASIAQQLPVEAEWYREFGSLTGGRDSANAVAVAGPFVYVAGHTAGALPGQVRIGGGFNAFVMQRTLDGQVNWIRQFGAFGNAQAFGVAADDSGVYVGGEVTGPLPGQPPTVHREAFVRKYDPAGNEVWTRQFAGSGVTQVLGVAVDDSGVYVCGMVVGHLPGLPPTGSNTGFLRKYTSDGDELWTRQVAGVLSSFSYLYAVTAAASGIYVTGFTSGELFGHPNLGRNDAIAVKFDRDGQQIWTRQFGSANDDVGQAIAVDGQSVYVIGRETNLSQGTGPVFARSYDAAGTLNWIRTISTPGGASEGLGAAADPTGVYVVGYISGSLPGYTNTGAIDAFVRKYSPAGTEIWTHQFGSVSRLPFNNDREQALGVAAQGDQIYVAGFTGGRLEGGVSTGGDDAFVRRYDAAGGLSWIDQFGSLTEFSDDVVDFMASDGQGHIYVAGTVAGRLIGQTPVGRTDAYLRKYDARGREIWTRQFGDPGRAEAGNSASGLAVDASGVYVVGRSSGGPDISFVRKFDADGNTVWLNRLLDSGFDATAVAVHDGAVYVAGTGDLRRFDAAGNEIWHRALLIPGRPTGADPVDIATDDTGVYVVAKDLTGFRDPSLFLKFSHEGVMLWSVNTFRCFGTQPCIEASSIATDGSGFYVGGKIFGGAVSDSFVMRYDTDGNQLWNQAFPAVGFGSVGLRPVDVAADRSGVYVTGFTCSPLADQTQIGPCDAYVRKYDPFGTEVWTRQFGRTNGGSGHAIAVDGFGIHVAGYMNVPKGTIFQDQDAFVTSLMNPAAMAIRSGDHAAVKLSGNGVVPIALLTTPLLDASMVDAASVCFGSQSDPTRRTCTEAHGRGHAEDADGDGDTDLTLHYRSATTGLLSGETTVCLVGRTAFGVPFKACQPVQIVR